MRGTNMGTVLADWGKRQSVVRPSTIDEADLAAWRLAVDAKIGLTWPPVTPPPPPPPPPPPVGTQPLCGVAGYKLATEWTFGTAAGNSIKSIADLPALFNPDAPWGRINGELEDFKPFNTANHVFEPTCLALTGLHDASSIYNTQGHITSGALVSKALFQAPCLVEFVAQIPAGKGVWPSLWLYDIPSHVAGSSDDSEIDVMESVFNAPVGQRDDRSWVYQNDHSPAIDAAGGEMASSIVVAKDASMDAYGRWQPGGASFYWNTVFAAYSVEWKTDRVSKYVNTKLGVTRLLKWPAASPGANILVYNSLGSNTIDWPGPVDATTFQGDNAKFRIRSIRIFVPA